MSLRVSHWAYAFFLPTNSKINKCYSIKNTRFHFLSFKSLFSLFTLVYYGRSCVSLSVKYSVFSRFPKPSRGLDYTVGEAFSSTVVICLTHLTSPSPPGDAQMWTYHHWSHSATTKWSRSHSSGVTSQQCLLFNCTVGLKFQPLTLIIYIFSFIIFTRFLNCKLASAELISLSVLFANNFISLMQQIIFCH